MGREARSRWSDMSNPVFVYGSFFPENVHYRHFAPFVVSTQIGFVDGQVMRFSCGFPGLKLDKPEFPIEGRLLDLQVPDSFWPVVDAAMGVSHLKRHQGFFRRVDVEVRVDNFSKVKAYTYALTEWAEKRLAEPIERGLWRRALSASSSPLSRLTEKQVSYLRQLDQAQGRDTLPISMNLYQELLNLELIADRGRRLALTPLGKEMAFFAQ